MSFLKKHWLWLILPLIALALGVWRTLIQQDELYQLKSFVENDMIISIPIWVKHGDKGFVFPDLIKATQMQLDKKLEDYDSKFHYKLIDKLEQNDYELDPNRLSVELFLSNENTIIMDGERANAAVHYTLKAVHGNDLPYFITQAIVDHLVYSDLRQYEEPIFDLIDNKSCNVTVIQIGEDYTTYKCVHKLLGRFFESFKEDFGGLVAMNLIHTINDSAVTDLTQKQNFTFYYSNSEIHEQSDLCVYEITGNITSVCEAIENDTEINLQNYSESLDSFITALFNDLNSELHLSEHPMSNLIIRITAVLKHITVRNISLAVEKLLAVPSSIHNTSKYKNLINRLYKLVDEVLEQEEYWMVLFNNSREILEETERLGKTNQI